MRQDAEIEQLARGDRVEVSGKRVESMLLMRDRPKERAQLDDAPAFGPRREHRAQVHTEHAKRGSGGLDFEEGVSRPSRTVPFEVRDRDAAHECQRLIRHRCPMRHRCSRSQTLDHRGRDGFLENDDIGGARQNRRRQRVLPAASAATDVVREQPNRHSMSGFSTSVRYG